MRKFALLMLALLTTCFTALVVASSAPTDAVQTLAQRVSVIAFEGAPLKLSARVVSAANPAGIAFVATNQSHSVVTDYSVRVYVFRSNGRARGFTTTHETPYTLQPGASHSAITTLGNIALAADGVVIVQLTTAAFDTGPRWMAPRDAVERVKSGVAQQQASDGTALGLAFNQDAPIALRGYLASQGSFLYETAKVENLSAKPVSALSFAVLVADPGHRHPPNLLRSSAADVTLLPGKTQDVPVRLLPASQLEDLKRSVSRNPKVTLGVMAVEWADGTKWVFRLPDDAIDFSTGSGLTVPAADQPLNRR